MLPLAITLSFATCPTRNCAWGARATARAGRAALPTPAYRRSYFAAQLRGLRYHRFGAMLRELAPQKYRALPGQPTPEPLACFRELSRHIATLFPVYDSYETLAWDMPEDATPEELLHTLDDMGIPVEPMGFYDDGYHLREGASPALTLAYWYSSGWDTETKLDEFDALRPYADLEWLAGERALAKDFARPPRGRAWRAPWDGLGDLLAYVAHDTDHPFLNFTDTDELTNPAWNLGEIRSLTRAWELAEPVLKCIIALQKYVDAAPVRRLPQFAGLLRGDKFLRDKTSTPSPAPRSKTLAQIFA